MVSVLTAWACVAGGAAAVWNAPLSWVAVAGGVVTAILAWSQRATSGGRWLLRLCGAAALSAAVAAVGAAGGQGQFGPRPAALSILALAWVVLTVAAVVMWSRRGVAVEKALGDDLLGRGGRPLTLSQLASAVNHVFCATDLESGDHFYLAPRFVYGYREGVSTQAPRTITTASAVQASAALPGAFPPVVIRTGPFRRDPAISPPEQPPERVVLSDGGVYDNMAEQWESGFAERLRACPELAQIQEHAADVLIVANASPPWQWRPFGAKSRIGREILGLVRDQGVQYDATTSRRRRHLIDRFTATERSGVGLRGLIVMVDRVPHTLAEPFTHGSDDVARRSAEAVVFLDGQHTKAEWQTIVDRSRGVKTTLGPITVKATLDLMEHAYTATVVGLYVLHGIGSLVPFPRDAYEAAIADR